MNRSMRTVLSALVFAGTAFAASSQEGLRSLPGVLDGLCASHWEDRVQTAFGSFTYEYRDQDLPTPFSRFLKDELALAISKSAKIKLFNRDVAAAMDPAFRASYGDFFAKNDVAALLSGRFFDEGGTVRVRLQLTSLRDGNLIGGADVRVPRSEIPSGVLVAPDAAAAAAASSLVKIGAGPAAASSGQASGLRVSVGTSRGPGGVYRDGEALEIMVSVDKDAYVKVYHVDVKGDTKLIWPNRFGGGSGKLSAGAVVRLPGANDPFTFALGAPYGTEFIKAVASVAPFTEKEADFESLGTDARSALSRGIGVIGKASGAPQPGGERAEALASYIILAK